ncbi:MAG: SUMF1/EgtB/PvdO family nonheme iron enzyme [Vicingaceae bacterium]|nr:SUMF1/EgtB/PvdO family nonheme iron enzyme [Vicingaceae bacterium]
MKSILNKISKISTLNALLKSLLLLFLILNFSIRLNAQNTIAKIKYEDAEKAFYEKDYQTVLDRLKETEEILGQTAPNILHLRILAQHKLYELNPFESFKQLDSLKKNVSYYLDNYDIAGLEEKYKEIYFIASKLPKDREDYQNLKKKNEAEQLLKKQKIEEIRNQVDTLMPMVLIERGEIRLSNRPNNPLCILTDYYIGKYEVTQKLWEYVMNSNPSSYKCTSCPVTNVSWYDVQDFIGKLNNLTERNYSLPSEAQWEYAAKGGKQSKGYKYSGSNSSKKVAWHTSQVTWSGGKNHPYQVGIKEPNELGIYDMSGNVYEWCHDWYISDLKKIKGNIVNPVGPKFGVEKVTRGGSYAKSDYYCEVTRRYSESDNPDKRASTIGFRLVLSIELP